MRRYNFETVAELLEKTETFNCSISEIMIRFELEESRKSRRQIENMMLENLGVMKQAIQEGLNGVQSFSKLTGGDAPKIFSRGKGETITGSLFVTALSYAVATNEVNAAMGTICATPTAGSAGILPGVLFATKELLNLDEEKQLAFLFTAAAFGLITANNACISGAEGGCQAEVGSATGMAAASLTEAAGGTPKQAVYAYSLAVSNLIGLACDPIAGLVEAPCINRNAGGVAIALAAAEMALAGVEFLIPADEVIETMNRVGRRMPLDIRETGIGGLAGTPTGQKIKSKLFDKNGK